MEGHPPTSSQCARCIHQRESSHRARQLPTCTLPLRKSKKPTGIARRAFVDETSTFRRRLISHHCPCLGRRQRTALLQPRRSGSLGLHGHGEMSWFLGSFRVKSHPLHGWVLLCGHESPAGPFLSASSTFMLSPFFPTARPVITQRIYQREQPIEDTR